MDETSAFQDGAWETARVTTLLNSSAMQTVREEAPDELLCSMVRRAVNEVHKRNKSDDITTAYEIMLGYAQKNGTEDNLTGSSELSEYLQALIDNEPERAREKLNEIWSIFSDDQQADYPHNPPLNWDEINEVMDAPLPKSCPS